VVKKGLAKALERKMGQGEGLISEIETKTVDSSLLMNATRRRIFQFICNNPGVHLRMISRELGFSTQTASWHLRKLLRKGLISQSKFGNKNHYYPLKDLISGEDRRILALFFDENMKRIYLHLSENPNRDQKLLISELNIYQQLLSKALITLKRHDLIAYTVQNKTKRYYVTTKLEAMEEHFDLLASKFQKMLVEALSEDGLDPEVIATDEDILKFEIDSGGSRRKYLEIQKNPVRGILKLDIEKRSTP
jgi:DNA-binding MarR family transcriptional regulator